MDKIFIALYLGWGITLALVLTYVFLRMRGVL